MNLINKNKTENNNGCRRRYRLIVQEGFLETETISYNKSRRRSSHREEEELLFFLSPWWQERKQLELYYWVLKYLP